MKTIFKYPIKIDDTSTVQMHFGAQILDIGEPSDANRPGDADWGTLVIWALVDNSEPLVDWTFKIRGTGHPCDDVKSNYYIKTVQLRSGLVFHVFSD